MQTQETTTTPSTSRARETGHRPLVDPALAGLIEVAAAVAANCEPCMRQAIPALRSAGMPAEHIMGAVAIGETVKEKPAMVMKEAADVLAGTELVKSAEKGSCPAERLGEGPELIRVLLISVGAAMAANCERCLNKAVPALIEAGANDEDVRRAIEIGQLVKDEAAAFVRATSASLVVSSC